MKNERIVAGLATVCLAAAVAGFAVATFRQNWNEIGWGAIRRFALVSAGMVASIATIVAVILVDILRPWSRLCVSLLLLVVSILAVLMMAEA